MSTIKYEPINHLQENVVVQPFTFGFYEILSRAKHNVNVPIYMI